MLKKYLLTEDEQHYFETTGRFNKDDTVNDSVISSNRTVIIVSFIGFMVALIAPILNFALG